MKSNFKRIMGIILAMLMIVAMLPVTAFAEDTVALTAADSPDYVMTADGTLKLLYNGDTITGTDGKTYVGFTIAKDYQNSGDRLGVRFATTETLSDGSANPDTKLYGIFRFQTGYPRTVKDPIEDVVMGGLPEKIADNLYLNTWNNTGSTYWLGVRGGEGAAKSITYITLPSGDNMLRHGTYLKTLMDDNPNPYQDGLVTYKGALVRDSHTYSNGLYDPATGTVRGSGVGAEYAYGSVFPTFYLALDALKEVKMDVATMGANVKALYADNFIQDDFVGSDYTADELTALGVVAVPENPTPAHSPNYLKIVAADGTVKEFLYNDTITQNGKTYIGLIGTKDFWSHGSGYIGASFRSLMTAGVDFEGEALPSDSNWYLSTNRLQDWRTTKYHEIHTLMSNIPTAVQPYLLKYNYDCGTNSLYDNKSHTLRTIGKLTWVSKDELAAHLTYLLPAATTTTIATRTGTGNHFYGYDKATGNFKSAGNYESPNGSLFMRMYVDVDMFKNVKLDISASRSAAKAMLNANFVRSDLEGIYTEAELDELGIESFTAEEKPEAVAGSSFVVDGKTFYYMNDTIDYGGKTYFRVFNKKGAIYWENKDAHYLVSERPEGGLYLTHKQGSTTGTDLQNMSTDFGVFGDYKISADYEWSNGHVMYNGTATPVYVKGSINVASLEDYKYAYNTLGLTFKYQGDMFITSTLGTDNGGTIRKVWVQGIKEDADGLSYFADGNYYKGRNSPHYNFVTYISEDFFASNELDIATTGEVMLNAIKENFTRDELAAGGWGEATLEALFNTGYTGTGLGLVAYKTGADSVAVIINNNDTVASTGTKLVVVAVYSDDRLEDVELVSITGTIGANSYTSKLPVTFDANGAEVTEIKVMLWDGIITAKPLAASVAIEN